jgi:putative flippase GtrA
MPAMESKNGQAKAGSAGIFRSFFMERSSELRIEIFRSVIVSGVSFIFDFGLLYVLTDIAHVFYLLSATISYGIGMLVSYILSVRWAFGKRSMQNKAAEFVIFVIIGVTGMGLNALILWLWTGLLGLHYLLGRLVSAVIGYVWKFVARKIALFR